MDSRMDKYNSEKPNLKTRTEKNKTLYAHMYDDKSLNEEFDLNSNMTVINTDSRVIDVDKIRDMLDRKYRVDERKHIVLPDEKQEEVQLVNTKEYDINSILEKARKEKNFDYGKERLKSIHNTQYDILKKLDIDSKEPVQNEDEENLVNLINTITALELKNRNNQKKNQEKQNQALEILSDLKDDEDNEKTGTNENHLLELEKEDYDEFEELKNDIKSNSILIKIVSILFVLILLVGCLILANHYFDLGLF